MPRPQPPQKVAPSQTKSHGEIVPSSELHRYTSGDAIRTALRVTDVAQLTTNLTSLRNQWIVHYHENANIASSDARLLLAKSYLELSPTASEIFSAWELLSKQSIVHQHLALGVFSALLNLLSTQYIYHSLGFSILRALLAPQSSRKLNAHLNSAQTDLVLVALKLWNAMSDYASGAEKKNVYEAFQWGNKSLFRLYHMRRKGQIDSSVNPFGKPDIRTLFITFVLGFIQPSTLHILKSTFLESQREMLLGLFKKLSEDPYALVRFVLETCWEGIWSDIKLKRTLKIGLFNVQTLSLLVKLYSRASPETSDPESIPADLIHHFLLALCTRPGIGLCFKEAGWYPREEGDQKETEEVDDRAKGNEGRRHGSSKIYNVVIGQLLKHLKPTEDARQQELALRIFQASPELVSGYWFGFGLATEPRLSSKWLINIAWIGAVISLPVPKDSFFLKLNSTRKEYHSYPPPLQTCLDNIIPSVWPKTFITKGLQSTSPLVQRSTALCLVQVLDKYDAVIQAFRDAEAALEEDEESGQWKLRRREIEREFRRKIPNFEVIVAFSQHKSTTSQWGTDVSAETPERMLRSAMVSESALRLMWAYHRSLPDIPSEARYDVGKLLLNGAVQRLLSSSGQVSQSIASEVMGFDSLSQLHILRSLKHSDQFVWSSTFGDTNQTQLCQILHTYVLSTQPVLLQACADLIQNVLAHSDLFDHDPTELNIWLDALPTTIRSPIAQGPNGEELVNERETVIFILDKCIRDCMKALWKYTEASLSVYSGMVGRDSEDQIESAEEELEGYSPTTAASPLLMTLLEMFEGLLKGEPKLPSSAALAVATYLRQLVLGISLKQPNAHYARRISSRLRYAVENIMSPDHSLSMINGIKREFGILENALSLTEQASKVPMAGDDQEVQIFLNQLEGLDIDSNNAVTTAYDLIDWIRLSAKQISSQELVRMIDLVQRWCPSALRALILQMDPSHISCTPILYSAKLLDRVPFSWLYLHLPKNELNNVELLDALSTRATSEPADKTQFICNLLLRRLEYAYMKSHETDIDHALVLWGRIVRKLGTGEKRQLHQRYALESPVVQTILRKTDGLQGLGEAISSFVDSFFISSVTEDHAAARELCVYWVRLMTKEEPKDILHQILPWVPFMLPHEHLSVLDQIQHTLEAGYEDNRIIILLHTTLNILGTRAFDRDLHHLIMQRLPALLSLRSRLQGDRPLNNFVHSQLSTIIPFGFTSNPNFEGTASSWARQIEARWTTARSPFDLAIFNDIVQHLTFEQPGDFDILAPSFWRSPKVRQQTANLFLAKNMPIKEYGSALYQLLDSSTKEDLYVEAITQKYAKSLVKEALRDAGRDDSKAFKKALHRMFSIGDKDFVSSLFLDQYQRVHDISSLEFVSKLAEEDYLKPLMVIWILEVSMKDIVSLLSEGNTDDPQRQKAVIAITKLASGRNLRPELFDAFFNMSVQECLGDQHVMKAFTTLIQASRPKPAIVNRLLQAILHHADFDVIASSSTRDSLVNTIYTLFQTHPQNTCQPSYVAPLIAIYGGTLDESDRQLLNIFQLFEQNRKNSCSFIISHWNPTSNLPQTTIIGAIANLDSTLMFRSCTEFPNWRSLDQTYERRTMSVSEATLYDPVFITLFLALFTQEDQARRQMTSMDWLQLFRSNIVSLLIATLSARNDDLRALGWTAFGGLLRAIQTAEFHEKAQSLYILQMLACLYSKVASHTGNTPRLPCITTLFFAHALRTLYAPSSALYPLMSRFLLQRPEFDPSDPPMLYSMLYSSLSNESWKKEGSWKRERTWILKFLADGMTSSNDWAVLRRRHTWDLLATTFIAHPNDGAIRLAVLKVLNKMVVNQQAATSLVLRSNILSWMEIQIRQTGSIAADDPVNIMWYQILEHLLLSLEYRRVENGSRGAWRADAVRCLQGLLERLQPSRSENPTAIQALLHATRILQRLSRLPDSTPSLRGVLHQSLSTLRMLEISVNIKLRNDGKPDPPTRDWMEIICRLWLSMMGMADEEGNDGSPFESLTARVVAFSSYPALFEDAVPKGNVIEWAMKETRTLLSIAT